MTKHKKTESTSQLDTPRHPRPAHKVPINQWHFPRRLDSSIRHVNDVFRHQNNDNETSDEKKDQEKDRNEGELVRILELLPAGVPLLLYRNMPNGACILSFVRRPNF